MRTKILGISGKKQAGKNTAANYILGLWIRSLDLADSFEITNKGELKIFTNGYSRLVDINNCPVELKNELDDFIRVYSFADVLKQSVCMDILGLTYEQCYGTDEQKMIPTHLKWEDMPGVVSSHTAFAIDGVDFEDLGLTIHEPGFMTGRDVMQFAGTEIFRKMYHNVWVDATLRRIDKDNPVMAIVADTRFINEVEGIQKHGGKVGRLTRDIFKGQDQHESETALDNYPLKNYDFVWDNEKIGIQEQNKLVHNSLKSIVWIPQDVSLFSMGS